jgi:uncharacterized coiled-coil DUF342 family protein
MKSKPKKILAAEQRHAMLVERREQLNKEALVVREERDRINQRKRELLEELRRLRAERNELTAKVKEHKKLRDELQRRAKELLVLKREKRGTLDFKLPRSVETLFETIQQLERRQETVPMPYAEEKKLVEDIHRKTIEHRELSAALSHQRDVLGELASLDAAVDLLFRKADEEHARVVELAEKAQEVHEKLAPIAEEVSKLRVAAERKHQQYLKLREEASSVHRKIVALRKTILLWRRVRREAREAFREELARHAEAVEEFFKDESRMEAFTAESLEKLRARKKIEL